jgi:peroxiredoxin Q/BCP
LAGKAKTKSSPPSQGDKAPGIRLADQDGKTTSLSSFKGKWIVLYFYPKDNTTGCTMEAAFFSDNVKEFKKLNAVILGVSPDTVKSHNNFIKKQNLEITLLSDEDRIVIEKYGCWKQKKMYGREYFGVERSTFLIDPKGVIRQAWRKVSITGHVEKVKAELEKLVK